MVMVIVVVVAVTMVVIVTMVVVIVTMVVVTTVVVVVTLCSTLRLPDPRSLRAQVESHREVDRGVHGTS
jgi:hypothetical protein